MHVALVHERGELFECVDAEAAEAARLARRDVEAQRAHAGIGHAPHFLARRGLLHDRHAAQALRLALEGVQHGGVVGAVPVALDRDAALEPEQRVQRQEPFQRGLGGRVRALGRKRKAAGRSEDVEMRVAGLAR
ncbi:hypothetical protein D3C83_33440 [compost metagenome]